MKRIVRVAAIAAALFLVVLLAAPFLIDPNDFRPTLESNLTRVLGRDVKLGDLKLAILSGGVTASDLAIADDPAYSHSPFVQARSLKIGIAWRPLLFSRRVDVTGLTIDGPQVQLLQSASGEWNFSTLGAGPRAAPKNTAPAPTPSGKSLDLSVRLIRISGGRFSLGRLGGHYKPLVLENVDAEVRNFSASTAFPFSFSAKVAGGGDLSLSGQAGPVDPSDLAMTPLTAGVKLARFDLSGSGWTQAVPGTGGLVALDASCESDGRTARLKGRLKAEKLKLARNASPAPRPVELDFAVDHNLKTSAGKLGRGDIRIGNAAASLTGAYAPQGETTLLKMGLSGPAMPIPELAAMLPALGIALPAGSSLQGGTATVKLAMDGPADRLITAGTIAFNNTTLAGFDLGRKMSVIEALAGMKGGPNTAIQTLSADLRMAPDGISAGNIQLVVPAIGELGGAGTISPANALDFKMSAKVHTSGLMAAVSNTAIPFTVGGTCADPVFRPDVKSVVYGKAKEEGVKAVGGLLKGLLGGKKN
jgi:AsmA protein